MKWFFLFLCILSGEFAVFSQNSTLSRPRLVTVLMVDELNTDQLLLWKKKFEKGGIARMMNQGTFIPNVSVNTTSSYQGSSVATFYTGATPAIHGIVAENWIDRFNQLKMSALYGPTSSSMGDSLLKPSCDRLLSSTVADELKRLYPDYSKVRAIGMIPDVLCWSVGHGNDGFYSFDIRSGEVVNKSLPSLPDWAREFNSKKFASVYRDREWGPINNINDYYESRFHRSSLPGNFLYRFTIDADYQRLVYSPFGNIMMRDFAVSLMINEGMGKDEYPDLLTVSFSLKPGVDKNCKPFDAEVEDMFLRLDHEVTSLIRFFEETIGVENVLMVFTGAHNPGVFPADYEKTGVPAGVFSGKKAISLLNLYFMAQYGQAKWVEGYHDGTFYLNNKLIADKGLSPSDFRNKTADFLIQMSGVSRAYTYDQLLRENSTLVGSVIHQSFHAKRSGDVMIELEPGWVEELDNGELRARPSLSRHMPVVFFGGNVPAQTLQLPYQMIDIAPTICTFLQISYPNGCVGRPIAPLFVK